MDSGCASKRDRLLNRDRSSLKLFYFQFVMDLTKYGFSVSGKDDKKDEKKRNTKGKKEEYETKRKRKFQTSWLDDFPGLVHESDAENDIMYCEICRDNEITADKSCSMFLGTSTFRKDTLLFHWKSQSHTKCAERQSVKLKSKTSKGSHLVGQIVECVKRMDNNLAEKCGKLFNTVYFVCKQEMPFTSYPTLIALQEKNGLDVGSFYRSDNACRRYIHVYHYIVITFSSFFSLYPFTSLDYNFK